MDTLNLRNTEATDPGLWFIPEESKSANRQGYFHSKAL